MGNASSCVCDSDGLMYPSMRGGEPLSAQELPSAPDIAMTSVKDGTRTTLRDFLVLQGCDPVSCEKPTVLQFYASWCGGSHNAADKLEALAEDYADSAINFVHICVDGDGNPAAAASQFHHNHSIGRCGSFHFYVDAANDRLAAERYDISLLPHKVIIGRDGAVEDWDCRLDRPDLEPYLDDRFRGRSFVFGSSLADGMSSLYDRSYDDSGAAGGRSGVFGGSLTRLSDRSGAGGGGGGYWGGRWPLR